MLPKYIIFSLRPEKMMHICSFCSCYVRRLYRGCTVYPFPLYETFICTLISISIHFPFIFPPQLTSFHLSLNSIQSNACHYSTVSLLSFLSNQRCLLQTRPTTRQQLGTAPLMDAACLKNVIMGSRRKG